MRSKVRMYVATVPNRGSPPAILLRESYRADGQVKTRTLKNLSDWPAERVALLRAVLRGDPLVPAGEGVAIEQALPHGHVLAALETARRLELDRLLPRQGPPRRRDLALALIVARLLEPAAKLATARALDPATASHSLGASLDLGRVTAKEVYTALDWLGRQQGRIEAALARHHLATGTLVLYDLTSTYLEGRCCPLAQYGYSRDHRGDKRQIVFGVLCNHEGCPVAVEVFAGNTADPATLKRQIDKLKGRFKLGRMVLVGDRGMITAARLREDLMPAGLDWITALRAPQIRALASDGGPLQLSLFDERDLAEITSPDYPGERLIVCRNPALAEERARKRAELLDATEAELQRIQQRVRRPRSPLTGAAAIGQAVGAVLGRRKMAKHFRLDITDTTLGVERDHPAIAAEARLDGLYVLRTSLGAERLDAAGTVAAYKSLAQVERAFRSLKTVDLEVRPVFHWTENRVRAHVFLCLLAYYLEWHMRRALAPILFADHDRPAAEALRASPVAPAKPSPAARRKAAAKLSETGEPVVSFRSLLRHLATLTRNSVRLARDQAATLYSAATPLQKRAFDLLAVPLPT
jgi:Transposase DDE domain